MTKEQEEALYRLKLHSEYAVLSNDKLAVVNKADIETVLSMLKEKDKEIESKNRLLQIVGIELNEAETKIEEKEKIRSLDIYKLIEDWETGQLIPVQKVKDKIEEYKNMLKTCNKAKDIDRIKAINERILELQELLERRK